jgi:hypothetical protein
MNRIIDGFSFHEVNGWIVDIRGMICINMNNGLIVELYRENNIIKGRIDEMPKDYFKSLRNKRNIQLELAGMILSAKKAYEYAIEMMSGLQ